MLLLGTKLDLVNSKPSLRKVSTSEAQNLASHKHMLEPIETSAKDNTNIERAFYHLAKSLKIKYDGLKSADDAEQSFHLNDTQKVGPDSNSSCGC